MKNRILLWLDDWRNPHENDWLVFSPILQPFDTIWVKSYNEFVEYITKNGLPDGICFDNSLGDFDGKGIEKTGYSCAKWLVEYCLDNNVKSPLFNSQSSEPDSRDRIIGLLNNLNKQIKKMEKIEIEDKADEDSSVKYTEGIGTGVPTGFESQDDYGNVGTSMFYPPLKINKKI